MTYKEWKEKISNELNEFVNTNCVWAFNPEQFKEALTKLNITKDEFHRQYTGFIGGGAIRKDKVTEWEKITEKQTHELRELLKDEDFAYTAFRYELNNYEYGYTYNETPALDALGLTVNDVADTPHLNRAFCKAATEIKEQD